MGIKIALVEDNSGIRTNWVKLIGAAPGFSVVAACGSGEEALREIPKLTPDVILMDINLPGMSGVECTARFKQLLPKIQILMVTVHGDNERVFAALQAGASGYLLKRTSTTELLEAIREVVQGGVPMTGEIARKVIDAFRRPNPNLLAEANLSARESEILEFLTRGFSNKEIAERLCISFDTVRTHLCHIYEKLHVRSRTEAATLYLRATEGGSGATAQNHSFER